MSFTKFNFTRGDYSKKKNMYLRHVQYLLKTNLFMRRIMRILVFGFSTRSGRWLEASFPTQEVKGLIYLCSQNKDHVLSTAWPTGS